MSDVSASVLRCPTGFTPSRAPVTASPPPAVGRTNVNGQDISPIKNLPVRRRARRGTLRCDFVGLPATTAGRSPAATTNPA